MRCSKTGILGTLYTFHHSQSAANPSSIPKLLKLCESVQKWRLCIRFGDFDWTHPSGAFLMLGDAVRATLPYLASGYDCLPRLASHFLTITVQECHSRTEQFSANASLGSLIAVTPLRHRQTSWQPKNTPLPSSRSVASNEQRWL